MLFLFNNMRFKLYPVLASFVAVKSVAHHQVNPPRTPRSLTGPEPTPLCTKDEKVQFTRVMKEAAKRAQRFLEAEATKYHIPGISYSVAVDGSGPYSSSYGFADIENNIQLQDDSRLRIGYITMLFTAVLGLQLVRDNRIGLNDNISALLTEYPMRSHLEVEYPVTLHGLLNHTSGMKDYTEDQLLDVRAVDTDLFFQNELAEAELMELASVPGEYEYSRYSYMLILCMIEYSYQVLYERKLLDLIKDHYANRFRIPVDMIDDNIVVLHGLSRHYQRNEQGTLEPASYVNPSNRPSIFGIVASPNFVCYLGHAIARSTQQWNHRPRNSFTLNISQEHAQLLFRPPPESGEPSYDIACEKLIRPCIFGKCLAEEHNTRSPMAWRSSSIIGSSSILLVKGGLIGTDQESPNSSPSELPFVPPPIKHNRNFKAGYSKPFSGVDISVAITCNLEGIELFPLANQIAGVYGEAFEEFERLVKDAKSSGGGRPIKRRRSESPGERDHRDVRPRMSVS